jgi:hypothetical protein
MAAMYTKVKQDTASKHATSPATMAHIAVQEPVYSSGTVETMAAPAFLTVYQFLRPMFLLRSTGNLACLPAPCTNKHDVQPALQILFGVVVNDGP